MTLFPATITGRSTESTGKTRQRDKLLANFANRIIVNPDLSRSLVSWQSNKNVPGFRWFKFKEGFSTNLVRYLMGFVPRGGQLLDPFAGTGVAPITAAEAGWQGVGIEILPPAVRVANALRVSPVADRQRFNGRAHELLECVMAAEVGQNCAQDPFPHIRITEKAFTPEAEKG